MIFGSSSHAQSHLTIMESQTDGQQSTVSPSRLGHLSLYRFMEPPSSQILSESNKLELSRAVRRRLVAAKLALYEEEARLKSRLGSSVQLSLSPQPLITPPLCRRYYPARTLHDNIPPPDARSGDRAAQRGEPQRSGEEADPNGPIQDGFDAAKCR